VRQNVRHGKTWFGLLCLLVAAGCDDCRGCHEAAPQDILALVEPSATLVVHVPDLEVLRQGTNGFYTRATRKSAALATKLRQNLTEQLGFDPLGIEDWSRVGIAAKGGLVVFALPQEANAERGTAPAVILALATSDHAAFDKALLALVERVDGANKHSTQSQAGYTLHTVGRPFGDALVPVLHWAHVGPFALLCREDARPRLEALLARLTEKPASPTPEAPARPSMSQDATYTRLAAQVAGSHVTIFVRGNAANLLDPGAPVVTSDAMGGIRLSEQGVQSDVVLTTPGVDLGPVFVGEPVLPLAAQVAPDALVVALSRSLNPNAMKALRAVPAIEAAVADSSKRLREQSGIDPETDGLPNFVGPLVVSLHLADLQNLPTRIKERRLDALLDVVHFAMVAKLKDPGAMLAVLQRSKDALVQKGVPMRSETIKTGKIGERDATLFEPDRPEPTLGWGVIGDYYVYTAGRNRLRATLAVVAKADSTLPQDLRGTVAQLGGEAANTTLLVARVGKLADALSSTQVSGPIGSLLELLRTLGDVAVSVRAHEGGLRLELREQLQ
jgi:hypothetical protein